MLILRKRKYQFKIYKYNNIFTVLKKFHFWGEIINDFRESLRNFGADELWS